MRRSVRLAVGLAGGLMLLGLTGCGDVKFDPMTSGIYLDRDGSVIGAEIESFDNSGFTEARYDADELKAFVEDSVKEYNQSVGGPALAYAKDVEEKNAVLPVGIGGLTVTEKEATLLLDYASCEEYMAFNEADPSVTQLSLMSAPAAVAAGVSLDGFVNADGEVVDTSKARESEKYYLATVVGDTTVTVNGKIVGVSGAEPVDEHTVTIHSDVISYILFR